MSDPRCHGPVVLLQYGMTPMKAIQAATWVGTQALGFVMQGGEVYRQ